ncbi:fumarylacetoacetate hydrolase family protein [Flagellimonas pacifica]|uniref:2-keto-4-pentenoate hydratase/2-oxohepta-3-ene-1,7-dioic acid hydratase (Catechol pathway) n=1 Tax=Flagellimonas pacifica TaxID=1247520 RepID=A0A285MXE4_9FLAO|nr:fumarylacetoacetate hydrolase family protein [Allomuricauda parva]SNZ01758.1 2-keto-4-pentenoate hydratase/2-oxohepta-3-ene-1,7-dioic acid hydratase (catechol pathway) [Allomuricauda parva]
MKLIRFGNIGNERPGVLLEDGRRIDVSHLFEDYNESFFNNDGLNKLEIYIDSTLEYTEVGNDVRLGSPVSMPSKIICIGLNYVAHAKESGMAIPTEPVVFFKATSSICGPFDGLTMPKGGEKVDWEVELSVVIGKEASYIEESEAYDYVAGYLLHNDYSERAFQLERDGQWVKGKSCDTFAPLGPFLATKDEIEDVHNLNLWLDVNGKRTQNGNTSDFIFNIHHIVSYLSNFMTLLPGDVISTGTPPGVGLGFDPPVFLKEGDIVEYGIDGLGTGKQIVTAYKK